MTCIARTGRRSGEPHGGAYHEVGVAPAVVAVRDVVTHDGEDFAQFEAHDDIPVSIISDCSHAEPHINGYDGKRETREVH